MRVLADEAAELGEVRAIRTRIQEIDAELGTLIHGGDHLPETDLRDRITQYLEEHAAMHPQPIIDIEDFRRPADPLADVLSKLPQFPGVDEKARHESPKITLATLLHLVGVEPVAERMVAVATRRDYRPGRPAEEVMKRHRALWEERDRLEVLEELAILRIEAESDDTVVLRRAGADAELLLEVWRYAA